MEPIKRSIIAIDATGQVPGRLASSIARLLMGKHKASYLPQVDVGDIVEVGNVAQMRISDRRATGKIYKHHTMHPGGLKATSMREVMSKNPGRVLEMAVKNMLPKNKLQTGRMKRLIIK